MSNEIDLEYYDMNGGTHHIYLAPGNVQLICNIMYNYEELIEEYLDDPPEWGEQVWEARMQYYKDRIRKVRAKVEESIGYSTEEHWERCKKKKETKDSDVGEDALVLAMQRKTEKKHDKPKKKDENTTSTEPKQLNLFDMI